MCAGLVLCIILFIIMAYVLFGIKNIYRYRSEYIA